jgi:nitrite reductase/ring-hydroxylating ferredoxin subunit
MGFSFAISTHQVPWQGATKVKLLGKTVLVFRVDGEFRAVNGLCPHLGVPLRSRDIESNGVITCWFHGAKFDSNKGQVLREPLSAEWRKSIPLGIGSVVAAVVPKKCKALSRFGLEVRGTDVWIDLESAA